MQAAKIGDGGGDDFLPLIFLRHVMMHESGSATLALNRGDGFSTQVILDVGHDD
jgi:hypothetical protein